MKVFHMETQSSSSFIQNCSVGASMQDPCHKTAFVRTTGLIPVTTLTVEDQRLLKMRCDFLELTPDDTICHHHEKLYLTHYESRQIYCVDPLKKHKKQITSKQYVYHV